MPEWKSTIYYFRWNFRNILSCVIVQQHRITGIMLTHPRALLVSPFTNIHLSATRVPSPIAGSVMRAYVHPFLYVYTHRLITKHSNTHPPTPAARSAGEEASSTAARGIINSSTNGSHGQIPMASLGQASVLRGAVGACCCARSLAHLSLDSCGWFRGEFVC